jgi:hypothetical protein
MELGFCNKSDKDLLHGILREDQGPYFDRLFFFKSKKISCQYPFWSRQKNGESGREN